MLYSLTITAKGVQSKGRGEGRYHNSMNATQYLHIEVNGQKTQARNGQTIAAALIDAGVQVFRHTTTQSPRGIFCGMGVCFECLVTVNGIPDQRACMTLIQPGMKIET